MLARNLGHLRSFGRRLSLPVFALVLIATGAARNVTTPAAAAPAPATPAAIASAPAPVPAVVKTAPAAADRVVPAVSRPVFDKAEGLSPKVLAMALDAVSCARARGVDGRDDLLTIIDYSLPSSEPRLWVLDLQHGEVLFHELVAHGRGSGDNYATSFSNLNDSHQSSLGLYLTGGTYVGGNGYSMVLRGLDRGVNDRAEARHIVMHGAWYVSDAQIHSQGRLGRSWGCPALSEEMAPRVIDAIKGGSFVFSYSGNEDWLRTASQASCPIPGGGEPPTTALAVN